jgi:hypothetical protein
VSSKQITIFSDFQEPYAQYGLQHFMKKYGFTSADNPQNADVYLGYSPFLNGQQRIQIIMNVTAGKGVSLLNMQGESIPLLKIPVKIEGGTPLIKAVDDGEEYPCASISDNKIFIGFDLFAEIGRILAGFYDERFLEQDQTGKTLRAVPVVDALEEFLFSSISQSLSDKNLNQPFLWPEGHKFALVVTHDVDRIYKTYQYLPSIFKSLKKARLNELAYHFRNLLFKHGPDNPYWTFNQLSGLDRSLGIKSTYYFLNETGRLNPFSFKSWILYSGRYKVEASMVKENIQKLRDMDYEIGVHGSYNSYRNQDLLYAEKQTLESIVGSEIVGIRQHHLNYDYHTTPGIHHSCGFKYDTSIGFKPDYGIGFRRGTSFPFQILMPDMSISPLLEIPLLIMDSALGLTAEVEECFSLLSQVEKYHGVLTILWHSNSLNQNEYPMLFDTYNRIIKEARERGAWIASAADVYKWVTASPMRTTSNN